MQPPAAELRVCQQSERSSYAIIDGGAAIRFSPCGITSHNSNDVAHTYCAACHRFIEDATRG